MPARADGWQALSVYAMSWVWEHSHSKGTARLVLLALADHAGQDGGDAYPSVGRLAARCGLSERTVQHAIKALVALDELTVESQTGPHGANRYAIPMTPAESAPPQIRHPAESAPPPRKACTPPPQNLHLTPADPAPEPSLTVIEPSLNRPSRAIAVSSSPPGFDEFWPVYPAKKAKGAAKVAFAKAVKRAPVERIIAGALAYANDPNRKPEFTKFPATWLNADCWDDEPIERRMGVSKSTRNLADWAEAMP